MRIGQAIDEIVADRSKSFKSGAYELFWDTDYQCIITYDYLEGEYYDPLGTGCISLDWELIQKSVSFMEVVESGEKFNVKHFYMGSGQEDAHCLETFAYAISELSSKSIQKILTEGKFYIQEEKQDESK